MNGKIEMHVDIEMNEELVA